MKELKVGIIGTGFIGQCHADAIARIPGAKITALSDVSADAGKRICREKNIEHFYEDYRQMLACEELDVIHNCTPNHLHYRISREILLNKIPIYCEKPLANHSNDTLELCRLAKYYCIPTAVNFNYRHNANVREMHERFRADSSRGAFGMGKPYLVRGCYLQDWMMYDTDFNWRCVPELGGPSRSIADIGSHWFDTVQYVTGRKIVRVFANLQTVIPTRKRLLTEQEKAEHPSGCTYEEIAIDSEDSALILVELEGGLKGQLTLSQVAGGHKNHLEISVDGEHYSMTWNQENPDKLLIGDRKSGMVLRHAGPEMLHEGALEYAALPSGHPLGWNDALYNGIYAFYRHLRGEAHAPFASFEDADYIVRIVEACMQSHRTGQWTDVI